MDFAAVSNEKIFHMYSSMEKVNFVAVAQDNNDNNDHIYSSKEKGGFCSSCLGKKGHMHSSMEKRGFATVTGKKGLNVKR